MRLNNFVALPVMTAMLTFSYPSSLTVHSLSTPSVEMIEEDVSEMLNEEEVNPSVTEEHQRDTTLDVPAIVAVHQNGIHYTQDEVRLLPAMEAICPCESGKQFHPDGTVVRGVVNPQDIGMCQINLKYHGEAAESLGFDVFTEEGNIRYTNHLYTQQGAQPWYLSKPCHGVS